jgi:hypothetical protein
MLSTSRFQKPDMVACAVSITVFLAVEFTVIFPRERSAAAISRPLKRLDGFIQMMQCKIRFLSAYRS